MTNKEQVLNLLKVRAEKWAAEARHAKGNGDMAMASEFFVRADSMREAIKIVNGALPDEATS